MTPRSRSSIALLCLVAACAAPTREPADDPVRDPSMGEVPLPAADGWEARLLLDAGDTGIWTVKAFPVFEQYAAPEVVALDDDGRCVVLVSYSGKWTPLPRVHEGAWLGGLAHADVDPRIPGPELFTGGKKGNLYQLVPYKNGALDVRRIGFLPGCEIHTIVAGELDPSNDTPELLVFTRPGALYRVTPTGPDGRFETELVRELTGRVRDAVRLPDRRAGETRLVTASRDGTLRVLRLTAEGSELDVVHRETVGIGRLSLGVAPDGETVLYVGLDDGRVLRATEGAEGWSAETIYAGPKGLRGLAAGRFFEDPTVEGVAVFGYSGKVHLLARRGAGPWSAETIFEDRDRGHWLATAELDERNATVELLGSGYGGRAFLLARPPGYGVAVTTSPETD